MSFELHELYTCTASEVRRMYTSFTLSCHIKIWITLDRNEIWVRDLHHSIALVEAAKSLVPSNIKGHCKIKGHGKVPYQNLG